MNKKIILLIGVIVSIMANATPAEYIRNLNKEIISFNGSEKSIAELIRNNPEFKKVALLHLNDNDSFEDLGTIGSPQSNSWFDHRAKIFVLHKEAGGSYWWHEKNNAIIVRTGEDKHWGPHDRHAEYIAMNKHYEAIEQEIEKNLQ